MGILHFAGLGTSPGAVTAGLSYIANKYGERHSEYGNMVEGLVIFTSPEVCNGNLLANEVSYNDYGKKNGKKTWQKDKTKVLEIVATFVAKEFPRAIVYFVSVDVNNFDACFAAIGQTVLNFHEPGKVGKHIWANITGGTNVLNAALTQVAYLSGCIPWMYYTFVSNLRENGKYLQPFTDDATQFRYEEVPMVKTQYDLRQQKVLEELREIRSGDHYDYINSQELLGRLKNSILQDFKNMDLETFKREFLNVMHGIERKGNREVGQEDSVRLSANGHQLLNRVDKPLFRALVQRELIALDEIEQIISELGIKKLTLT